jgi:hypothetical protein
LIIVSQVVIFFIDGHLDSPASLVGAIVNIILAAWLCRGSITASYILSALSIFGLAGWVLLLFTGFDGSALMTGLIAFGFVASFYLWWAVTFSKKVRAELARRREANKIRNREERQRFYQEMGETVKD